jgi:protocatechuate 3,4-dioxygenase beta subunit
MTGHGAHGRDDAGRLSRRAALAMLGTGAAGAAALVGCEPGRAAAARVPMLTCTVRPRQTEGPYFVDERLLRSDVRIDPADGSSTPGKPLRLRIAALGIDGQACTPLEGAHVDIWQCDALGVYSDVLDAQGRFDTRGRKFLRGYQLTDADGVAEFLTIFPGWYEGRTPHIHFKIRVFAGERTEYEFTSQLYFSDALADQVYAQAPYAEKGPQSTRNDQDGIYRGGGTGAQLLVEIVPDGDGLAGTFEVGLRMV